MVSESYKNCHIQPGGGFHHYHNALVEASWCLRGLQPYYRGSVRLWIDSTLLWIKLNCHKQSYSSLLTVHPLIETLRSGPETRLNGFEPTNRRKRQSQYSSIIFTEYKKKSLKPGKIANIENPCPQAKTRKAQKTDIEGTLGNTRNWKRGAHGLK